MRSPEPVLTTAPTPTGMRVTAGYETPEMWRLLLGLSELIRLAVFAIGTAVLWRLAAHLPWLGAEAWLVLVAGGTVASFGVAGGLAREAFHARRYVRRWTDARLVIDLDRAGVGLDGRRYHRGAVIRFTVAPHRQGKSEEREERLKERLLPFVYRDASEVWLQCGETFVRLAATSDEEAAKMLVRRLQEIDERVARGMALAEEGAYGTRQVPA